MSGRLLGIAGRLARRQPMTLMDVGNISADCGLAGDFKGGKYPRRQITVLSVRAWQAALDDLADLAGPLPLAWTSRRANLLVDGCDLPTGKGSRIAVGGVVLEVTGETYPCARMDEVHRGLLKALAREGRGGATCRVVSGGEIAIGDPVAVLQRLVPHRPRLPG